MDITDSPDSNAAAGRPIFQNPRFLNPMKYRQEAFNPDNRELIIWPCLYEHNFKGSHVITAPIIIENPNIPDLSSPYATNLITEQEMATHVKNLSSLSSSQREKYTQLDLWGTKNISGDTWFQLLNFPLVSIRMGFTDIKDLGMVQLLKAPFWKYGYMQFLDMEHNIFMEMDNIFSDIPLQCSSLQYLDLQNCFISNQGLHGLVKSNLVINLVDLNLEGNINLSNEVDHFVDCSFTCLKKINLNYCNMTDNSLRNLIKHCGHTLIDLRYGNNEFTYLNDEHFFESAGQENQEYQREKRLQVIMCYSQLQVIDFSYNQQIGKTILRQIIECCDTKKLKQIHLNSTGGFTGEGIFDKPHQEFLRNLKILNLGRSTEVDVPSLMNIQPITLYDIFYGQPIHSIGEQLNSITFSMKNIGKENNSLAYLVWAQKKLHERRCEVQSILNLLKKALGNLNLANSNLNDMFILLVNPNFFKIPSFDDKFDYDLNFEEYASPFS